MKAKNPRMIGGKKRRAAKRLNLDHFLDFFSMNFDGAVMSFQLKDRPRIKMFPDFLVFLFLPFSELLFFAFCLALEVLFLPVFRGGGVDLFVEEDFEDDDFLADLEAVFRVDFFVVFLGGIVA